MGLSTEWTPNKAPSALNPTATSFLPPDGNMIPKYQAPASDLGVAPSMPRVLGAEGPQSGFARNGQAGSMEPSGRVPRK